eukprot:TRINITY_DN640_c1_g1_i6.p2 TRINITY_DN640_c1_g1~~TRINITY_DN640_c1_g1_i6.p2  ORF type:complete len:152 (-),score=4.92 TRINITY_DN640_c1_g1_i6:91-546(-)
MQTCYNGAYRAMLTCEGMQIAKSAPQFGLQAATRLHEAGIASNRGSAYRGECVPEPCTHRPSSHGSRERPKSPRFSGAYGEFGNWDQVVTRQPQENLRLDHLLSKGFPQTRGSSPTKAIHGVRTPASDQNRQYTLVRTAAEQSATTRRASR